MSEGSFPGAGQEQGNDPGPPGTAMRRAPEPRKVGHRADSASWLPWAFCVLGLVALGILMAVMA